MTDALGELLEYLTPAEQAELDQHLVALDPDYDPVGIAASARVGEPAPDDWHRWLTSLFPGHFTRGFAPHHEQFWAHLWAMDADSTPDAFVGIWAREGGKSTGAEVGTTLLGVTGRRKYALYVRATQEQADTSVANIAMLLEDEVIERHYPAHANRMLTKYGDSKAWRRNRLVTAGGFVVDALGLDTAVRGIKFGAQRPDLFVIDDIDEFLDGPHITKKKRDLLTHSVLPSGSQNAAVVAIQNLIIRDGIFSQLADGRADFLADRVVSGPHPALLNLKYEWRQDPKTKIRRAYITQGTPTWQGQDVAACQRLIGRIGLAPFLKECQHKVQERAEGVALRFEDAHYIDLTDDEGLRLVDRARMSKRISLFGGIDFGAWRFGFTLWVVNEHGVVIRLAEYFAQRRPGQQFLHERARAIHELCESWGIPAEEKGIPIWGDQANPTDIQEVNLGFKTGWEVEDERGQRVFVQSKLRVVPVASENKLRKTSVDRLNDMLDRNLLRFRRSVAYEWLYDMHAGNEGTPQYGSRLAWEMANWSYPTPRPGQEQDQDPDDSTADGADCIASMRYAVMSVFGATKLPVGLGVYPDDKAPPIDFKRGQMGKVPHAADDFLRGGGGRRMPAVKMPRPRTSR